MTRGINRKRVIRARMRATGERYTEARAFVFGDLEPERQEPHSPGSHEVDDNNEITAEQRQQAEQWMREAGRVAAVRLVPVDKADRDRMRQALAVFSDDATITVQDADDTIVSTAFAMELTRVIDRLRDEHGFEGEVEQLPSTPDAPEVSLELTVRTDHLDQLAEELSRRDLQVTSTEATGETTVVRTQGPGCAMVGLAPWLMDLDIRSLYSERTGKIGMTMRAHIEPPVEIQDPRA